MSEEHLVSKCLFDDLVTVRGFQWCQSEFRTIPIARFVANCLCRDHNGGLSGCDAEAKTWQEAVHWLMKGGFGRGDGPFRGRRLDGFQFARWLAKTACNIAASSGEHVPRPLANYAFRHTDDPGVHIYLWTEVGTKLSMDPTHIGACWVHVEGNSDAVLVCFLFYGLPLVISTIPIDGAEAVVANVMGVPAKHGFRPMDRVREIRSDTKIPGFGLVTRGRLDIKWPAVSVA